MTSDARLRELAMAEMRNPSGAYDQVTSTGDHPLAHLLKEGDEMPQLGPMSGRSNVAQKIRQNFGADQEGAINSDEAISLLHILLDGISDPSERAAFVGKLSA